MLVTVEGIEGCGKTTLIAGLSERLRALGVETIVTREPGGTNAGEAMRALLLDPSMALVPLAEALLVSAARAQHLAEQLEPALKRGVVVLCDRFDDSTLAYQGYGRGMELQFLRQISEIGSGGRRADVTFVLDVPVAISRLRVAARPAAADRFDLQNDHFHERVRAGFLELARSDARYYVMDGTRPPGELLDEAYDIIEARLA